MESIPFEHFFQGQNDQGIYYYYPCFRCNERIGFYHYELGEDIEMTCFFCGQLFVVDYQKSDVLNSSDSEEEDCFEPIKSEDQTEK